MAYDVKPGGAYSEDEDEYGAPPGLGTVAPTGPLTTAGAPSGAGTGDSGSRFVNFERYFNANADAANKMAGGLADQVEGNADKAIHSVYGASDQFNKDVAAGTPRFGGEMVDAAALTTAARSGTGSAPDVGVNKQGLTSDVQKGVGGAPLTPGTNEGQIITGDEAKRRAQAQYTGPKSLTETQGFADAQKGITGAQSQVDALGADRKYGASQQSKLSALIQDLSSGRATQGGNELDASLTGYAGRGRFDALNKKYAGLQKYLDDAAVQGDVGVKEAMGITADTANKYGKLGEQADAEAFKQKENAKATQDQNTQVAGDRKILDSIPGDKMKTIEDIWKMDPDSQTKFSKEYFDEMYGPGGFDAIDREMQRRGYPAYQPKV